MVSTTDKFQRNRTRYSDQSISYASMQLAPDEHWTPIA